MIQNFYHDAVSTSVADGLLDQTNIYCQDAYAPFTPILDRVMVKRIVEDNSTKGGLVIPEKYRQQSNKGEVIAAGEGVWIGGTLLPMPVAPGDRVLFGSYNAEPFMLDGEEYLLVRVQDIRGVERRK